MSLDHSEFNENCLSSPVAAGSLVPASIHIVTAPEHDRDEHHGVDRDEHHGADHDGEKINHCHNESFRGWISLKPQFLAEFLKIQLCDKKKLKI